MMSFFLSLSSLSLGFCGESNVFSTCHQSEITPQASQEMDEPPRPEETRYYEKGFKDSNWMPRFHCHGSVMALVAA